MGTIGGNLCNASPSADTAPPLIVFNARVKLLRRASERTLDLQEFFKGVNCTALGPDEMMVEILLDPPRPNTGSAFMKISRVGADISKVSCAVALERKADLCLSCRVALGAVAPVPMRANGAEGILEGKKVETRLVEAAAQRVAEEIKPIADIRSTAEYRRWVATVIFRDVFWKAWRRAAGEEK
jgi:carbon-monoxide dehydrogenase medium subunit